MYICVALFMKHISIGSCIGSDQDWLDHHKMAAAFPSRSSGSQCGVYSSCLWSPPHVYVPFGNAWRTFVVFLERPKGLRVAILLSQPFVIFQMSDGVTWRQNRRWLLFFLIVNSNGDVTL